VQALRYKLAVFSPQSAASPQLARSPQLAAIHTQKRIELYLLIRYLYA
jgi:hypothetical protein